MPLCVCACAQHFTTKYWRWPDAVHLLPQRDDPSMGLPVWDPTDERDRLVLLALTEEMGLRGRWV